jgi:hypothetical protein
MSFRGTCHCGRFVFELQGMSPDPDAPTNRKDAFIPADGANRVPADADAGANTHRWVRERGALLSVPRERLRLLSSEEGVGAYTFSGRIVGHRFCGACGTHLYGEDLDNSGPGTAYVNPWCIARGLQASAPADRG